jgi:hypothetical protein
MSSNFKSVRMHYDFLTIFVVLRLVSIKTLVI